MANWYLVLLRLPSVQPRSDVTLNELDPCHLNIQYHPIFLLFSPCLLRETFSVGPALGNIAPCGLRLQRCNDPAVSSSEKGASKNLERMARAAIIRPDEALRREDTGSKYPTEEQQSMGE